MSSSSSYVAAKSAFNFIQKRFLALSNVLAPTVIHKQSESANLCASKALILDPSISEKHASVINFFKSAGFSDAHIAKLATKRASVFKADVEKTIKPKIDCLLDYGFSGSFVHDLIVAQPLILTRSLNSHLLPILHLLQTHLGSNEKVVAAVKRCSCLLSYASKVTMEQNLNFLVNEGVPMESISKLISGRPRTIMQHADRVVHSVKSAKQFGFLPAGPMFICAITAILAKSETTMYERTEFLKNLLGLSEEEVKTLFKRDPKFINYSEDKMKNVANFFIDTVRVESSFLPCIPKYFSYSIDKRLVPRYSVYKILQSENLLKKGKKFSGGIIRQSDEWFEINYVLKYLDRVPNLMELYRGISGTSDLQSVTAATK